MPAPRPRFHLAPPHNWMNDPNGLVFWEGRYHVFYQHNPFAPKWGDIHWGHASSADLVHWLDHGVALTPSTGPDEDGCWSGCGRVVDGVPTFFYTGVSGEADARLESVCVATGGGDLTELKKSAANPVVAPVRREHGHKQYRDPFVLHDAARGRWLMLLGSGIEREGQPPQGCVVTYSSLDCRNWDYAGVLFALPADGGPFDTGSRWECPQLVRVGEDWVLIVSIQLSGPPSAGEATVSCPYAVWFVGDFDGSRFVPRSRGLVDGGDVFYAPAVMAAPDGRVLMWGWLQETASQPELDEAGFAGALSVPRELGVHGDRLVSRPASELSSLWVEDVRIDNMRLTQDSDIVGSTAGSAARIRFRIATDGLAGLAIGVPGETGQLLIALDGRDDPRLAVIELTGDAAHERGSVALATGTAAVDVEVYLDSTIVEVFAGSGEALTTRDHTWTRPARELRMVAVAGSAELTGIAIASLRSTWSKESARLTRRAARP